jgi:hypothetical protein
MITLEQIRLLEGKITRAIELIRVLKEENSTLRKGLESAHKRMKELESLVEGFKTDQKEIESVIVRTLRTLDELEESSAAKRQERAQASSAATPSAPGGAGGISAATPSAPGGAGGISAATPSAPGGAGGISGGAQTTPSGGSPAAPRPGMPAPAEEPRDSELQPTKEELDIF